MTNVNLEKCMNRNCISILYFQHPGGIDPLQDEAGTDATRAIEDIGHSADARAVMGKYKIGEIVEVSP